MTTLKKINKTYHILIYSQLTTNTTNQSSSCTALFDFGLLPRGRWKVKYYGGFGTATYNNNVFPQIHVDFGERNVDYARNTSNAYPASSRLTRNYVGNMMSITNYGVSSATSFNIPAGDNGYFYLDETPTNNFINITVLNLANVSLWTPNMSTALFGFAFELLDDPIYRTVQSVYNVVFNSVYGTNNNTSNNSLGDKNYYFDWSRLPEGEYEVSTTLHTSTDQGGTNYTQFTVFCNFGQGNSTTFTPTNTKNEKMPNNNFLSVVYCEQPFSTGPLVAYSDYSPPVFLNARPCNSNVNLLILSTYSGQFMYSRASGVDMNYTICFTFRWLGGKY